MSRFQQQNHKASKETGRYGSFKRKNELENIFKKYQIVDLLDKKTFLTTLKEAQRAVGRYGQNIKK